MFAIWALAFWYGGKLVHDQDCNFVNMFKAVSGIVFGAMFARQAATFAPNATEVWLLQQCQ